MPATIASNALDEDAAAADDVVQLARLALSGREQDVQQFVHRLARRYARTRPDVAERLIALLREAPRHDSPIRSASGAPAPVDLDSRLTLVRHDVSVLDVTPIFSSNLSRQLNTLRDERRFADRLTSAGLTPSRTALFVGPPGVGKTLAARWLASELNLPLLVLDLSAVMSSLLGRTGVNIRRVLDYAKKGPSVLLLDELDAVAKRRDDATEIGELKRLVTVLLQEIDDWPHTSLLLAATNHPDLLDPAVWRRFDHVVEFGLPGYEGVLASLRQLLREEEVSEPLVLALAETLVAASYSEVERLILDVRRRAVIAQQGVPAEIQQALSVRMRELPVAKRIEIAVNLADVRGLSQRKVHELTGVSRDTIRRRTA